MEIYFFILLYGFFTILNINNLSYSNNYKKDHKNQIYYFFIFIFIILFGLNGNYDEYSRLYLRLPTISQIFYEGFYYDTYFYNIFVESGILFSLIISFFKTIQISSQFLFLFYISVSLILMSIFYKKFTRYYMLALLIYLCHLILSRELSGVRDAFIGALILPMIFFIANKKSNYFNIIFIISILHHFLSTLSYFIKFLNFRLKRNIVIFLILISYALYFFEIPSNVFFFMSQNGLLPEIVTNYMFKSQYSYDLGGLNFKSIQQAIVILLIVFLFNENNFDNEELKYFNLIFNTYLLGTILMIIMSEFAIFANRFNGLFSICEPICITYLVILLYNSNIVSNFLVILSLLLGSANYIFSDKVEEYKFLIDWETENIEYDIYIKEQERGIPR